MSAYSEGFKACKKTRGLRPQSPYATGTSDDQEWFDGWNDAMEEIKDEEGDE